MDKEYFNKRSDITSFVHISSHLIVITTPIYISAIFGVGIHLLFFWLFIGLGMNGILNLIHECSHYHIFKKKESSQFLGRYILGPLLFADFEGYRERHWDHHKYLGVEGETKDAYRIDIRGIHIFLLFIRCLFLFEAFKKFFKQIKTKLTTQEHCSDYSWVMHIFIFQPIFYCSLLIMSYKFGYHNWANAIFSTTIAYFFVYLYGLMSLTNFMADLRAIAEHQIYNANDVKEGYASLRNFRCNWISRFLFGSYGFGEHYTHHKVPGIPYYNLPLATVELAKEDHTLKARLGYFDTIWEIMRKLKSSSIESRK